jgi:hypothetical protein
MEKQPKRFNEVIKKAPQVLFYSTLCFLIISSLLYGGYTVMAHEYQNDRAKTCTTEPALINTPFGVIEIGTEGEQNMDDPFKAQIVNFLDDAGLSKVNCN